MDQPSGAPGGRNPHRIADRDRSHLHHCHIGIARELPDMTGVDPGWLVPSGLHGEIQPGLGGEKNAEIERYLESVEPVEPEEAFPEE